MSELADAPRHRRIRRSQYLVIGAVITLLALGVAALSLVGNNAQPSSYEKARAAYERALLDNPNRTNSDFGVQIHDNANGAVYTY